MAACVTGFGDQEKKTTVYQKKKTCSEIYRITWNYTSTSLKLLCVNFFYQYDIFLHYQVDIFYYVNFGNNK